MVWTHRSAFSLIIVLMDGTEGFSLALWDMAAFAAYFVVLSGIGYRAGRAERKRSEDYFLAGRTLPWYVVGGSFVASNISTEHFIGMIGAAYVYGVCVAMYEWGNIGSFTLLIWIFIPFLLSSRVVTTPEFLEKRFTPVLRHVFAMVTILTNVVAFLAAVLYGGALALQSLFGWGLWPAIIVIAVVAGTWAIYGGLRSVAWTDFFTVIVMIAGGLMVTILGLYSLSGDEHALRAGWDLMIERNRAEDGIWARVVAENARNMARVDEYDRLSVIQPVTHATNPWPSLFFSLFTISIWYNVINQFMIQRVLGAKNMYHARMGIVLAGYLKILMPAIVVLPGLILFARYPEVMDRPWDEIRPEADKGYVHMLQTLIPVGLRGLFLAALFGAIQSTVNSVLNATATVFTLDVYKQLIRPTASDRHLIRVGIGSSAVILAISIVLGGMIKYLSGSLFEYIQSLYAFFAPPFSAVFLLGLLFRRINATGATWAVFAGFVLGIGIKLWANDLLPGHPQWIEPFPMQAIVNWTFSTLICVIVSLRSAPARPEQVTDQLTLNWSRLNIFTQLGGRWYTSVVLWWAIFAAIIVALMTLLS